MNQNQLLAQRIRDEHGMEMTPGEVEETLEKAFGFIRRKLREQGFQAPDSDEELAKLIKKALRKGHIFAMKLLHGDHTVCKSNIKECVRFRDRVVGYIEVGQVAHNMSDQLEEELPLKLGEK